MKPRKIYLAFQFVQDTKLNSGSAAGCLGLMNVSQGSWVCREPGAALQASPYRLQSALGQGVGEQSRLLSLELASKQASGHISNELVVTF